MFVSRFARPAMLVSLLLSATSVHSQTISTTDDTASGQDVEAVIQKLNDPEVQQRVGTAVREATLAQLSEEGITLTPELIAEMTARAKDRDASEVLAAGAVFIATVAMFGSDERLKENIMRKGTSPSGIPIYEFSYKGFSTRWRGVMAQDVLKAVPSAVHVAHSGHFMVDYSQLDVVFESVN